MQSIAPARIVNAKPEFTKLKRKRSQLGTEGRNHDREMRSQLRHSDPRRL